MKDALRARGGAIAWADHLPWVMLGIRAAPKEESGTSAGEAALGQVLAVPGQLLSTTALPVDTPAPPSVIPVAKRTYAETAATLALDGATHVYLQRGGVGPPLADNYAGPLPGTGEGGQGVQAAGGHPKGGHHKRPAEAPRGVAPLAVADPPRRGRPPRMRE